MIAVSSLWLRFPFFWGGLNFDIGNKNSCLFWAMLLVEFYMFILVISGLQ